MCVVTASSDKSSLPHGDCTTLSRRTKGIPDIDFAVCSVHLVCLSFPVWVRRPRRTAKTGLALDYGVRYEHLRVWSPPLSCHSSSGLSDQWMVFPHPVSGEVLSAPSSAWTHLQTLRTPLLPLLYPHAVAWERKAAEMSSHSHPGKSRLLLWAYSINS